MSIEELEWQRIGDDTWIFGTMVRGVVRGVRAEIYFDEDNTDKSGGWNCIVHRGLRSNQPSLQHAVNWCEAQVIAMPEVR